MSRADRRVMVIDGTRREAITLFVRACGYRLLRNHWTRTGSVSQGVLRWARRHTAGTSGGSVGTNGRTPKFKATMRGRVVFA